MQLCRENAGARPQAVLGAMLIAKANGAEWRNLLQQEERRRVIADIVMRPMWGSCTGKPDLFASQANPS